MNAKAQTGQITWGEDRKTGKGVLTLAWDDGSREQREWDTPINSHSDSHEIAAQFGSFASVDHDREFVHVSRVAVCDEQYYDLYLLEEGCGNSISCVGTEAQCHEAADELESESPGRWELDVVRYDPNVPAHYKAVRDPGLRR